MIGAPSQFNTDFFNSKTDYSLLAYTNFIDDINKLKTCRLRTRKVKESSKTRRGPRRDLN